MSENKDPKKEQTHSNPVKEKEDRIIEYIQEYCHANGYYLSKLEIVKL